MGKVKISTNKHNTQKYMSICQGLGLLHPSEYTPVSWISIAAKAGVAGTYTITASPTDETFVKANNYELWATLDDYKTAHSHVGRRDALVVTVNTADCDCSEVVRTEPSLS